MSEPRAVDLFPESAKNDGVAYLFGTPISHSMSPYLHGTAYEGMGLNWRQYLLESTDIPLFLNLIKEPKCIGNAC